MAEIITWADGYGVWHVSVPVSDDSESAAWDAIFLELAERSHPSRMAFAAKHMTVTSERITNHGTRVYRETWPGDFPELHESE
jgi:hypothetical protein